MHSKIKRATVLFSLTVGVVGCSQGNTGTGTATAPAPLLRADVPHTPEAAVTAVQDGLRANKPIVVWEAMTAADQAAVNKVIRETAEAIDPDVWNSTVENVKKLVHLAETKKEILLKSPLLRGSKQIKLEEEKASWDPGLALAKTLIQSELVDRDKMMKFDGGAFLPGTGAKLLAQARDLSKSLKDDPLKQFLDQKIAVKKISEQSATATVESEKPRRRPTEIPLTLRDGKWSTEQFQFLPYLISERVESLVNNCRPYRLMEWKDGYLAEMKRIGRTIDRLQAAKTSDEFQTIVSTQVLPYVLQKTMQFAAKRKPMSIVEVQSQSRPNKATLMILIKGEHFGDEPGMMEVLKLCREAAAEGKGTTSGPNEFERTTLFFVNPITDTDAFSKKIHIGKVTQIDTKKNKIFVELPTSRDEKSTAEADHKPPAH